jgi:hypothetical protein
MWELFLPHPVLTLIGGLCCVGSINFIGAAGVWRQILAFSIVPTGAGST